MQISILEKYRNFDGKSTNIERSYSFRVRLVTRTNRKNDVAFRERVERFQTRDGLSYYFHDSFFNRGILLNSFPSRVPFLEKKIRNSRRNVRNN